MFKGRGFRECKVSEAGANLVLARNRMQASGLGQNELWRCG